MQSEHIEQHQVSGLEIAAQQSRVTLGDQADGVDVRGTPVGGLLDDVVGAIGVVVDGQEWFDEVGEAVRVFDDHQWSVLDGDVSDRDPGVDHWLCGSGEEGVIVVQRGGSTDGCGSEIDHVEGSDGLGHGVVEDGLEFQAVCDSSEERSFADGLPEQTVVFGRAGSSAGAGGEAGFGRIGDFIDLGQVTEDFAAGCVDESDVQGVAYIKVAVFLEALGQFVGLGQVACEGSQCAVAIRRDRLAVDGGWRRLVYGAFCHQEGSPSETTLATPPSTGIVCPVM